MGTWLGVDWVAVQAVATLAMVLILAVTLRYAAGQVTQVRRSREEQLRPYVVVDIEPSATRPMADLYVTNLGATAAYSVTFAFTPSIRSTREGRGSSLKDSALLSSGVPTLPPGREIRALLDDVPARIKAGLPMRYDVHVSYVDRNGTPFQDRYVADLGPVLGLQSVVRKDAHEAAKALERVARTLESWTVSNRGVRTFAHDHDRYAWRNGHLIRHPRWLGRVWVAMVERVTGVDLNPASGWDPYELRGWRFWAHQAGARRATGSRSQGPTAGEDR